MPKKSQIDFTKLYANLYERPYSEIKFHGYLSENLTITDSGFAYLVITPEILKEFNVDSSTPSNMINDFSNIRGVYVWMFATFDERNEIYKEWSGMDAKQYKEYKGLRKESLRDNMSELESALADIGELTTRKLAEKHKPIGLKQNRKIAKEGGEVASNTRKDIEARLGESVVTKDNALYYEYLDEPKQIDIKKEY